MFLNSKNPWNYLICWLYWKEGKYLKLLTFHWLRKIVLYYICISKILATAFGTVLIPERRMFLLLRTEHTFFKVLLHNPILYSYLIWRLIMPGLIWKHLCLIVKINCALRLLPCSFWSPLWLGCDQHPHPLCQSVVPSQSNAVLSVLAAKWLQCMSGTIF